MPRPAIALDFSRVQLYGRQEEEKALQDAARMGEVTLLYGYAGSGKTQLVETALAPVHDFVLARGKFDQLHDHRPFSALLDAVADALQQICRAEDSRQKLCQRLSLKSSTFEVEVLSHLIPVALFDIVGLEAPKEQPTHSFPVATSGSATTFTHTLTRVGNALEEILRKASALSDLPVVLFLDDLQFGDAATMDLLLQLATSSALTNVGFVFAYRDNEVDQEHPWANRLARLPRARKLHINGLCVEFTEQLLQDLTRRDRDDCHEFAVLLQQKTLGNPFYILQVLDMLQQKHLLEYNIHTFLWEWDLAKIQTQISLTQNVIDVVVSKLQDESILSEELQHITHIAACLGQRFDIPTIQQILPDSAQKIPSLLQKLQDVRIIQCDESKNDSGNYTYKWGHDQIQQAAYSTIPQPLLLHWQIGLALRPLLSASPSDTQILTIVYQLNQGISKAYQSQKSAFPKKDRIDLAKWNIRAAEIGFQQSAYNHAIPFIDTAMGLFCPEQDQASVWSQHYDSMLTLSVLAIKAYFCVGRLPQCAIQIQQHYNNTQSIDDNLAIYPIEVLMTQNGIKKAIDRGIEVMNMLAKSGSTKKKKSDHVQRHPGVVTVLKMYWRIRKRLKQSKDLKQLVLSLPAVTDKPKEGIFFDILGNLTAACWTAADHMLMAYLVFLGVERQLDHGFVTAFPFALLTSVMGTFLEYDLAYQMAEAVLDMIPRTPREDQARSEICVRAFGLYRLPIRDHINPTLRAHKLALEVGDNLWAGNAGTNYIQCCLHSGHLPLGELCDDATFIHQSVKQLQALQCLEYIRPIIQAVVNLNAKNGHVQLDGAFAQQAVYKNLPKDKLAVFLVYHTYQLMVALHFQDMDLCREVTDIYWKGAKEPDGLLHSNIAKRFYYGLAAYALAGSGGTGKRKQFQRGQKMEAQLKALAKNKCVNCVHLLLALVAERTASKRKNKLEDVKIAFDKAIVIGMRAGFVSDTALTCHRAALYFRRKGDTGLATQYTEKSLQLYSRWEAWAVVEKMCNQYGLKALDYSSDLSGLVGSSSMRRIKTSSDDRFVVTPFS